MDKIKEHTPKEIKYRLSDLGVQIGNIAINYITDLEKENAELKKNYEDSLVACGVLKNKVDLLAQPSPIESMQDVLITTQKVAYEKQKEKLTKAIDIIKRLVDDFIVIDGEQTRELKAVKEAEAFLKEEKL